MRRRANRLKSGWATTKKRASLLFDWSMAEFVERYLEDERLQVAYLGQGVIGTNASPFDKGTASIRFHHASGRLGGMPGMWGYVRGGMGMVSFYFCDAAREAGATVVSGVPVAQIIPGEGVRLEGGERIAARTVISNADPRRTLRLLGEAADRDVAGAHRAGSHRGLHGEAQRASARAAELHGAPGHRTSRTTTDRSMRRSRKTSGRRATRRRARGELPEHLWCELYFQSVHDASVAPAGTHTMSVFAQYVPYKFAEGDWDSRRDEVRKLALKSLGRFCSNIDTAVIDAQVLGPPDIEKKVGLTGGHIFQGECLPPYMWDKRLTARTPMPGFYLCGACTHPGGSVIGVNGRNAAMAVLKDLGLLTSAQVSESRPGATQLRRKFDFSRLLRLCYAPPYMAAIPALKRGIRFRDLRPVLRGQWPQRALDCDGRGGGAEHPDGVGRGAGLLLYPAGRERDGTLFATS